MVMCRIIAQQEGELGKGLMTCTFLQIDTYSKTSEERTLWGRPFCPLFGGCPLSEAPTFNDQYSCSKVFTIQHIIVRTDTLYMFLVNE